MYTIQNVYTLGINLTYLKIVSIIIDLPDEVEFLFLPPNALPPPLTPAYPPAPDPADTLPMTLCCTDLAFLTPTTADATADATADDAGLVRWSECSA